jgi:hypothetical protein
MVPVGIGGVEGKNALEVAAVSLTTKGMVPMRTPCQMSGRNGLDANCFVFITVVFALLVVCAIFVSVASWEIEMHGFSPLTGQEDRFRRMRGWL